MAKGIALSLSSSIKPPHLICKMKPETKKNKEEKY